MNPLIEKIKERGYWLITIKPNIYIERRIEDISSLYSILQNSVVKIRGWDFPHLDDRTQPAIGLDWISQDFEWEHHLSSWRFYQSGQFAHFTGFPIDWRDASQIWPPDESWEPNALLGVGDALVSLTEIFEFAARLSMTNAGDDQIIIEITLSNLQNRKLYVDSRKKWGFSRDYQISIHEFPTKNTLTRDKLIANARELALEAACELFKRFDWQPEIENLRNWQNEFK